MNRVLILLSTYNGEKYLEEQLESFMVQTGVDVNILVRDDGSTDRTREILDRWQQKEKLTWYKGENIGWAMSFMNLVQHATEADYYAFSDQDDVWLPEKLNTAVTKLNNTPKGPALYFSNLDCWKDGLITGKAKDDDMWFDKYTSLLQCQACGCTMVFNQQLLNLIKRSGDRKIYAHDFWTFQVAMFTGSVLYDKNSYILYRQHSLNQVGAKKTLRDIWKRRWSNLILLKNDHRREILAQTLLECVGDSMSNEGVRIVSVVAHYRVNLSDYLKFLFSKRYIMDKPFNTMLLKLRVLIRKV